MLEEYVFLMRCRISKLVLVMLALILERAAMQRAAEGSCYEQDKRKSKGSKGDGQEDERAVSAGHAV